jgi:hypothetical protein
MSLEAALICPLMMLSLDENDQWVPWVKMRPLTCGNVVAKAVVAGAGFKPTTFGL